ncbi:MAG: hypothetical protein Ct9H300mP1_10670 [Planctomycetaceae bacterium]|nr:MAG: hypothetical protein Ct9H300mP1_10670 [Planctomycetaceae bacterium]
MLLGLVFVHYINQIENGITWMLGRKVFDETIYYFPEIPTAVNPLTVGWVALGAIAIAVWRAFCPHAVPPNSTRPGPALRVNSKETTP